MKKQILPGLCVPEVRRNVAEFGERIKEYDRRAKLYDLEDERTRDFFLNGLEDSGTKEKLFDERLATFEDAERRARELSDSRLMDVWKRHSANKMSREGGQMRKWRGEKMSIIPRYRVRREAKNPRGA